MVTSTIVPFGTTSASGTISKNGNEIGTQTFLGCTVVDFSCNSSWDSQGGSCTVKLIEDSTVPPSGQRMEHVVVGSPQYFEIATTGNDLVFRFHGLVKDIGRTVSPNGERSYTATLQTPTVLLSASAVITQDYAGAGDATEAVAPNVASSIDFGLNDPAITWGNVYNVFNPFGMYENDDYGLSTPLGFGASQINPLGMRLDRFVDAVDALVNDNLTTDNILGGPILYGTDDYHSPTAYHYSFDIRDFISQISAFIPFDYRVKSDTLMSFVDELCNETNHVYMIDLLKPNGLGNASIVGTATAPSAPPPGTIFGGEITVITQNRNIYAADKFPLSKYVVNQEIPDKLGGFSLTSFANAFNVGFGGVDLPLDFAWNQPTGVHPGGPAVASSPFGGSFPVETIAQDDLVRLINSNLNLSLNEDAIAGKMITGGFQSRINFVPATNNVYQYWGDIKRLNNFGGNAAASETAERAIPVITEPLDANDIVDCIMIDIQDLLGNTSIVNVLYRGIYPCSMVEMRYAMTDFGSWKGFLERLKIGKLNALTTYFTASLKSLNDSLYDENGNLTYAGKAYYLKALSTVSSSTTSSKNADSTKIDCANPLDGLFNMEYQTFLQKLHAKIKSIGDEHYGQSWIVTMPAFTTKKDQNDETVVANFIRSWELSDSAYLEPSNFAANEAPQSPYFVNGGRLKSYVNYDANFTSATVYGGNTVNYDFAEYQTDKFAQTQTGADFLFSFLTDVQKDYIFLPTNYFTDYHRNNFTNMTNAAGYINNRALSSKMDNASVITAVTYLLGASSRIVDNGIGMLPYALCKTKRVYEPLLTAASAGISDQSFYNLREKYQAACVEHQENEKNNNNSKGNISTLFPNVITPRSFGIPTQSNRFVYGPWLTTNINADYAAKIEYVQDTDLVPENYIIPTTITIGGVTYTLVSGLAGLNTVAQAKANTVDNFTALFTESASLTRPGLPQITSLGQSLVTNGPLVSDISVNISSTEVNTTYAMKTFQPKLGRTNKSLINTITKLGRQVKSIPNLLK